MLKAEAQGITSKNVDAMKKGNNLANRRLVGAEGDFGKNLGVDNSWCANIVSKVGNYGEAFARDLSVEPLNIQRGKNALWSQGGIQYAPPIR